MKKFSFSLDKVLEYKNQVLGSLQNEHAKILADVLRQENYIELLENQYKDLNFQFNEKKTNGMTVLEAASYEGYFRRLEVQIEEENEKLAELRKEEDEKREEVVEAKKETSSIEKLKEKKVEQYRKETQKVEEQFIEEFVSLQRLANG